jgi:hypothetical protein
MAEGHCFFCKQQGHVLRGCPKKLNHPFNVPANQPARNTPLPPHIQATRADNKETIVTALEPKEGVNAMVNSISHLDEGEKQELIDKLFTRGKDF